MVIDASPSHYVPYHVGLRMPFFPTRWMPTLDWFVEMVLRPAQVGECWEGDIYVMVGWEKGMCFRSYYLHMDETQTTWGDRSVHKAETAEANLKTVHRKLEKPRKKPCMPFLSILRWTLPLFRHCRLDGVWSVHLLISEDPCYYKLIHYYSERGRNNSTSILWKLCNSIFKYSSLFLSPKLQTIDISWCKVFHFTPPRNFAPSV